MEITKLLKKDHDEVKALFKEFEGLSDRATRSKEEVAALILRSLDVHTQIEEKLFYPELEQSAETADMIREAYIEHKQAKILIGQLRNMKIGSDDFDAKMKVLREDIEHHVKEEESEMFPASKDVLDEDELEAIGEEAEEMKMRLMGNLAPEKEAQEEQPSA